MDNVRLFRFVITVSPALTRSPFGNVSSGPVTPPAAAMRSLRARALRSATISRVGAIITESTPSAVSAAQPW